jgi:hypothetical protein
MAMAVVVVMAMVTAATAPTAGVVLTAVGVVPTAVGVVLTAVAMALPTAMALRLLRLHLPASKTAENPVVVA